MQDAVFSQNEQALNANKNKNKILLAGGIAATFAVGALIGTQFANSNNTALMHMQSDLYCTPVTQSAELRAQSNMKCFSTSGSGSQSGMGNVSSALCNGQGDQAFTWCTNGQLATSSNTCLGIDGSKVTGQDCQTTTTGTWSLINKSSFTPTGSSYAQTTYNLQNSNGQCMVLNGSSLETGSCGGSNASFYFNDPGAALGAGYIKSTQTGDCINMNTRSNLTGDEAALLTNKASSCPDQGTESTAAWTYYENGWIVNSATKWCLETSEASGNGEIYGYPCTGQSNQIWSNLGNTNTTYNWVNAASSKCLGVSNSTDPQIQNCTSNSYQIFNMQAYSQSGWSVPTGWWKGGQCAQGASISHSVQTSVSYSGSKSDTVTTSVAVAIKAGVPFGSVTTTASVSNSLSEQFSATMSQSITNTVKCTGYVNSPSTPFTGGCLYIAQVGIRNMDNNLPLNFGSNFYACTTGESPLCPPMMNMTANGCAPASGSGSTGSGPIS